MNTKDYENFIKLHFPYSKCMNNETPILVYRLVYELNMMSGIFKNYIGNRPYNIFLDKYINKINKLLLYIPLNDQDSINFIIRSAVENIIKFIVCKYSSKDIKCISKMGFRNLKEEIQLLSNSTVIDMESIDKLFSLYGQYSNDVHGKDYTDKNEIKFLQSYILNENLSLSRTKDDVMKIIESYYKILNKSFNIKFSDFGSAERIRIRRSLSNKRYEKINIFLS